MNTLIAIACAMTLSADPREEVIDREKFVELMRSLHSRPKTVSFIYEGTSDYFFGKSPGPAEIHNRFQGFYVLRKGNPPAALLEYYWSSEDKPPARESMASVNNTIDTSTRPGEIFDRKTKKRRLRPGSITGVNSPWGPEFCYLGAYFEAYQRITTSDFYYKFLGWETVDSRVCLKVEVASGFHEINPIDKKILWIDLERGGHPLRIEHFSSGHKVITVNSISLRKFDTREGPCWMPISGQQEVYGSYSEPSDKVTSRTAISVVTSSIKFDEELPDSYFVIHTKKRSEHPDSKVLAGRNVGAVTPTPPPFRTDPESMKKRLDADLAKAEQQRREVEASAPSRDPFQQPWLWQGIAATLVLCGLVGLVVHRRGRGRGL